MPLALIITAFCALAYLLSQQMLRLGANEPQVQLAQDTAARLSAGEAPASVVPAGTLDVGRSLAPFTILYDDSGQGAGGYRPIAWPAAGPAFGRARHRAPKWR